MTWTPWHTGFVAGGICGLVVGFCAYSVLYERWLDRREEEIKRGAMR